MRVKNHYEYMDVYGIYWTEKDTCFACLMKDGFHPIGADELTIVDPHLSGDFVYFDNGIWYRPIIEEKLLDDLQEQDYETFQRFLEILKNDGDGSKYRSYLELKPILKPWQEGYRDDVNQ